MNLIPSDSFQVSNGFQTLCAKKSITNAKESINNSYAPLPHGGVAVTADMPGLVL